jgi:cysteine synthase
MSGLPAENPQIVFHKRPFKEDDLVVLIFPDHGSRYITKV